MMTIKHIAPDGHERVFQVDEVNRTPDGELVFTTTQKITKGKVYIMNDNGKTVATYDCK